MCFFFVLFFQITKGTTDSVYVADDGKSPGQSRAPGAAITTAAPVSVAVGGGAAGGGGAAPQPSPREGNGVSPQPSPSSVRQPPPAAVENTTQNLTKLAQRESAENLSELEEEKPELFSSSGGVSAGGTSSIRSSPGDIKSPSLVRHVSDEIKQVTSPITSSLPVSVPSAVPSPVAPIEVKPLRFSEPLGDRKHSAEIVVRPTHRSTGDEKLLALERKGTDMIGEDVQVNIS